MRTAFRVDDVIGERVQRFLILVGVLQRDGNFRLVHLFFHEKNRLVLRLLRMIEMTNVRFHAALEIKGVRVTPTLFARVDRNQLDALR